MSNGRAVVNSAAFLLELKRCNDVPLLLYYLKSSSHLSHRQPILMRLEALTAQQRDAKLALAKILMEGQFNVRVDLNRALYLLKNALSENKADRFDDINVGVFQALSGFLSSDVTLNNNLKFALGICYERGLGVAKNRVKALACYKEGIENNSGLCAYQAGQCLEYQAKDDEGISFALSYYAIAYHLPIKDEFKEHIETLVRSLVKKHIVSSTSASLLEINVALAGIKIQRDVKCFMALQQIIASSHPNAVIAAKEFIQLYKHQQSLSDEQQIAWYGKGIRFRVEEAICCYRKVIHEGTNDESSSALSQLRELANHEPLARAELKTLYGNLFDLFPWDSKKIAAERIDCRELINLEMKLAKAGDRNARFRIEQLLTTGNLTIKSPFSVGMLFINDNIPKAIHYYKLGAEKGEAAAAYQLAAIYGKKSSPHYDPYKQAKYIILTLKFDPTFEISNQTHEPLIDWLRGALGSAHLYFALLVCYLKGYGVDKNPTYVSDELLPTLYKMAEQDRAAKYYLGRMLALGEWGIPVSSKRGTQYLYEVLSTKADAQTDYLSHSAYQCLELFLKNKRITGYVCLMLGRANQLGLVQEADPEKARYYYDLGITVGEAACAHEAALFFETGQDNVPSQPALAADYAVSALSLGQQDQSIKAAAWAILRRLQKRYPLQGNSLALHSIDIAAAIMRADALQNEAVKNIESINKAFTALAVIAETAGPLQSYAALVGARLTETLSSGWKSQTIATLLARVARTDESYKNDALEQLKAFALKSTYGAVEINKLHQEGIITLTNEYVFECEQLAIKRHRNILGHVREKSLEKLLTVFENLIEQRRIITLLNPDLLTPELNQEFAYLQNTVSSFIRSLFNAIYADIEDTFANKEKPKSVRCIQAWVSTKNLSINDMLSNVYKILTTVANGTKASEVLPHAALFYARQKVLLEEKLKQPISFTALSLTPDCLINYSSEPIVFLLPTSCAEPSSALGPAMTTDSPGTDEPAPSFLDADLLTETSQLTFLGNTRSAEDYIREGAIIRHNQTSKSTAWDEYLYTAEMLNRASAVIELKEQVSIIPTLAQHDLLMSYEPLPHPSHLSTNPLPSVLLESLFPKVPDIAIEISSVAQEGPDNLEGSSSSVVPGGDKPKSPAQSLLRQQLLN